MKSNTLTQSIVIRRPRPGDMSAMLDIWNWASMQTSANFRSTPQTLEEWSREAIIDDPGYPWLVATMADGIAGFAKSAPFKEGCGLATTTELSVYVHPGHHGCGFGSRLYRELIELLAARGVRTLLALITAPNPPSERLHAQFEFRRVGLLTGVGWKFGRWHDVGIWERRLIADGAAPASRHSCDESGASPDGLAPRESCHA